MIDNLSTSTEDLQPWLLVSDDGPACWRLQDDRVALAMFTDENKAMQYADRANLENAQCVQPSRTDLVRTLMMCVGAAIEVGVLNPNQSSAKRVFDLPGILKKVREDLRAGKPL